MKAKILFACSLLAAFAALPGCSSAKDETTPVETKAGGASASGPSDSAEARLTDEGARSNTGVQATPGKASTE